MNIFLLKIFFKNFNYLLKTTRAKKIQARQDGKSVPYLTIDTKLS